MAFFAGYQQVCLIYESDNSLIYRARREKNQTPVILKALKEDYPSSQEYIRYKQEYKITSHLKDVPGAIQTYGMEVHGHRLMIVLEDFGAESLKTWMEGRTLALSEALELAIAITEALGKIHQARVIHKDINPANIVLHPETKLVKIIDFGISTLLPQESQCLKGISLLEGTLAYLSPEQTGRMNRSLDYRTDYYSLGASLYHLLTGRPPFAAQDPMGFVHAHLARLPVPPHELNPEVPRALSEIVRKLLAKTPEERYQTTRSILADLSECHSRLLQDPELQGFEIGRRDKAERLVVAQQLYGREREAEALREGFERVALAKKELMLIGGHSGVGKTALVQELFKPLTLKRGYYVSGKFDQLQRNRPYLAFASAFQQLIRQLLTETDTQIARWRRLLHDTLWPNARVILELIPELERVIGQQPEVEELPPAERQNRFNLMFQRFIRTLAQPEHPLVVFVDDLQWADAASLQLLERCLTSPDSQCLYLIGAYRDNEVGPTHPLLRTLGEIENSGCPVSRLTLSPLGLDEVVKLVAGTLHSSPERVGELSRLLQDKTHGNPFFLHAFLRALVSEGLLYWNASLDDWGFELPAIQAKGITDNVADLLAEKLKKLSPQTQEILSLAACLGNRFDLFALGIACDRKPRAVLQALEPAVVEGLVAPLGDQYKAIEHEAPGAATAEAVEYRFAHDRIQQASYGLIPRSDLPRVHAAIGRRMVQGLGPKRLEQQLFEVVNHLNFGRELCASQAERDELARLNLVVGKKAKSSAAYVQSWNYLQIGRDLAGEGGWRRMYALMLALTEEAAESAYLSGHFEAMEKLVAQIESRSKNLLEKAKAYQVLILGQVAQGNLAQAVDTGLSFLGRCQIQLPSRPTKGKVLLEFVKIRLLLFRRDLDGIVELPEMQDPLTLLLVRIMTTIAAPAYWASPNLYAINSFKRIHLCLKHGNNKYAASAYLSLATMLCGVIQDHDLGWRIGNLALRLEQRFPSSEYQCRNLAMFNLFIRHWKEHLKLTLAPILEAYQIGRQNGDVEWAGICAYIFTHHVQMLGKELTAADKEIGDFRLAVSELKQASTLRYIGFIHQVVRNLQDTSADPGKLSVNGVEDAAMLELLEREGDHSGMLLFLFSKYYLCCIFHRYEQASALANQTTEYFVAGRSLFAISRIRFFHSLSLLGHFEEAGTAGRRALLRQVGKNQRFMRKGVKSAPMNHLHLFLLVEAERSRVKGNQRAATLAYRQATATASRNGYVNDEGYAAELAGRFHLSAGRRHQAKRFLKRARACYLRWGATAKLAQVDACYRDILVRKKKRPRPSTGGTITHAAPSSPTSFLDINAVIKASQSISGEIQLERLLEIMMKIVIEAAGAEKGLLILQNDGHPTVEAIIQGTAGQPAFQIVCFPLDGSEELPRALVRYVLRSHESLVLGDATRTDEFARDPYVVRARLKSVLCCPILRNGVLLGALYLENNQTTDVFTPDRVELLHLLASQTAISIENARLYRLLQLSLEKEKESMEKEKESMRVRDEFLARTSHELRTPLNAIVNLPEFILQKYTPYPVLRCTTCGATYQPEQDETLANAPRCSDCDGPATLVEDVHHHYDGELGEVFRIQHTIQESGRSLLQIINNILEFGEQESKQSQLQLRQFGILALIGQAVELIAPIAAKKEIQIQIDEVPSGLSVRADWMKLGQVLYHLLDNAIKFSPHGSQVKIGVTHAGEGVSFYVADHGIGIAAKDHQFIFESFRQVEEGTTRKYGGTGLGLAISKNLMTLHGGDIRVESQLGQGSTFFAQLPHDGPTRAMESPGDSLPGS